MGTNNYDQDCKYMSSRLVIGNGIGKFKFQLRLFTFIYCHFLKANFGLFNQTDTK